MGLAVRLCSELIVNPVNAGLETAQSLIQNALNPEIGVQVGFG